MQYRPEIDGLRAIAVLPVILFHAGLSAFGGGYVGVDIFFVISGYLITTIIINDIEKKNFSIIHFYERRARRILPALFLVMFLCIPFAWVWMLPSEMYDFSKSLIAVSFFVSNILFWRESDYFAPSAEEKPLLHTWSLAVEEQYYLLFPIFLLVFWRLGTKRVFYLILFLALISFFLSEWGWRNKATANFYLSPTRAWELLAGSLTSFSIKKIGIQNNNILAVLGLFLIGLSIFIYDETTPFPSIYTTLPVIGTVLLIIYAHKETFIAKILSNHLIVGMGLISYPAYLWHQPLFAFAKIRSQDHPAILTMIVLSAISVGLAYISWKYFEKPFRNKKIISKRFIFSFSICGILFFSLIGLFGIYKEGHPSRIPPEIIYSLDSIDRPQERLIGSGCNLASIVPKQPMIQCSDFLINETASTLLIGDSHLDAVGLQIQQSLKNKGIGSYAVSYSGCIPIKGLYRVDKDDSHRCSEYNDVMIEFARAENIKTLILIARFPLYLLGSPYDNGEGGVESGNAKYVDGVQFKSSKLKWNDEVRIKRVSELLKSGLEELSKDFQVIIFSPTPEVGTDVPKYHYKKILFSGASDFKDVNLTHSYTNYRARVSRFNKTINSISNKDFLVYDFTNLFCSSQTNRCITAIDKQLLYRDDDHLSSYSAKLIARDFIKNYEDIIKLKNKDAIK